MYIIIIDLNYRKIDFGLYMVLVQDDSKKVLLQIITGDRTHVWICYIQIKISVL